MTLLKISCLTALWLHPAVTCAAEPADKTLLVEVLNLRNERGMVGCALFNSAAGFPDATDKALRSMPVAILGTRAVCEFRNLTAGTYAVSVFHDENKNGKLDKNLVGMPKEGYGTSNDVRPAMSAPEFKPASFVIGSEAMTALTVRMGY